MASPVIRLDAHDNVVIARVDIPRGSTIPDEGVVAVEDIPAGHKIAVRSMPRGEPVLKYRTRIGVAADAIAPGTWVHSHNLHMDDGELDFAFARDYRSPDLLPPAERATFLGIRRERAGYVASDSSDGARPAVIGTRNYIGVFITVNCSATVARRIANYFDEERLADYPNVDGVVPFIHEQGCGMEMSGEPMDLLHRTLGGYVRHPNLAGALVISLGCERNQLARFFEAQGLEAGTMLRTVTMQQAGGTAAAIEAGKAAVRDMLVAANQVRREPVSAEHLVVGLQCGGSDGFSGLSANPALGKAVDRLVCHGGTAILSELPELVGVHHTLTARARNEAVGRQLLERIDWWREYSRGRDTQINGRVAPGNNAGGLANIVEKALGGAKKSGAFGIEAVYRYAEPVTARGVVIMDTPGYDPVSATGQIAGGANLVCFTTGRGSCFGSFPAPTVKLASNTPMYERMQGDMDVNCGVVIDGDVSLDAMGDIIFRELLEIASGRRSKSEALGIGEDEFVPWPIGVLS